jgi:hypothetical protein
MVSEERVQEIISEKIRLWKRIVFAFFLGLTSFFGVDIFLDDKLRYAVFEKLYPMEEYFKRAGNHFQGNSTSRKEFVGKVLGKEEQNDIVKNSMEDKNLTLEKVTLNKFPTIKNSDLPNSIKNTITKFDMDNYRSLIENQKFYSVLKETWSEEITYLLESTNPVDRSKLLNEIKKRMDIKVPIVIKVVEKKAHNRTTRECLKKFNHHKLHAVLAFPTQKQKEHYWHFRCPRPIGSEKWFPAILLGMSSAELGEPIDNVNLVEVQQNKNQTEIELRVSRALARKLKIEGWRKYSGRSYGKISISDIIE